MTTPVTWEEDQLHSPENSTEKRVGRLAPGARDVPMLDLLESRNVVEAASSDYAEYGRRMDRVHVGFSLRFRSVGVSTF